MYFYCYVYVFLLLCVCSVLCILFHCKYSVCVCVCVCKCVLYYCHRVSTQLQLLNISYIISYRIPNLQQLRRVLTQDRQCRVRVT